ncbi:armadillo repeat-containing protein 2-like isoform X2 [Acanthaster planci]|nr:armadillo repeat-containing protein 2-like isoform X2 [Acanthaster planci]XP_022081751.1 armadillo repeat-containing protein 2-like isoform X2 [Acanthaster planci]
MAQVNKPPQSRRQLKELKPFYEKPANVETSSDIIKEARSSLRTVCTKRPFTPQDDKRTLFGGSPSKSPSDRPPSAFSLGARHFDGSDIRPKSNTRLTPLDHSPSQSLSPVSPSSSGESLPQLAKPPKPPPLDPSRPMSGKRRTHKLKSALSKDGSSVQILPQPLERRLSNPLPSPTPPTDDQLQRRVHSGPKERTRPPLEEGIPRVKSADSVPVHRKERERVKSSGSSRAESGYVSDRASSGSRSGDSSREEETAEEALYWNTKVNPVLERLVPEHTGFVQESEEARLCTSCKALYNVLDEGSMLGKACKRRRTALRAIFKLIDVSNPRVQLQAARLMMALGVSGNNLNMLSKLILKVSKDNNNDLLFLEDNILDLIMVLLQDLDFRTHSHELLVYLVGSIRFLTQNHSQILEQFVKLGTFRHVVRIMASVNEVNSQGGKLAKGSAGIMLQLLSTLRNFLNHKDHQTLFMSHHTISEICRSMELYPSDADITMHIARIFSKLTVIPECCTAVGEYPSAFQSLLALISRYQDQPDVVVRLSFALGNMTAKNDDFRYCLFNAENAMETLLNVLRHHFVKSLQKSKLTEENTVNSQNGNSEYTSSTNLMEDVLIKIIRVIANLSINNDIGPLIASNENCVDQLMQILDYKDVRTSEELVLNTVITINNLSFYDVIGSEIVERRMEISRLLLKLLMTDNMEGMIEAARVFGNLSRAAEVRDYLTSKKVDEMMVTLLDAQNREVVYTACGVLINLMADDCRRHILKEEGGIKKLIDVLVDFGRLDWQLAGMVCMTLWNYSENITSSVDCFGEQETGNLIDKLADFLDEDTAMETPEDIEWDAETREFMRSYWRTEFCPVASQLLDRVEKHQADLVPIGEAP